MLIDLLLVAKLVNVVGFGNRSLPVKILLVIAVVFIAALKVEVVDGVDVVDEFGSGSVVFERVGKVV